MKKCFLTSLQLLVCLLFVLPCCSVYGSKDQPFPAGSQLPQSTLPVPDSQQILSYLGLTAKVTKTPPTVLVAHSGKVLWSHIGVIEDFDGLLKDLRENLKKQ